MGTPLVDRIPFAKIVTVLAIIFGVSLGLCGVSAIVDSNLYRSVVDLILFLLVLACAVGLAATFVLWSVLAIVNSFLD